MHKFNNNLLIEMYTLMCTIRKFEETAKQLYQTGRLGGALHLSIGQEAIATGVCKALRHNDWVTSTHRGHGHIIAKGCDLKSVMAELMGKTTGCSHGYGGSMHMFAPHLGFMGSNGIVGGGVPIALGAAFSAKYRKTDEVAVSFFGDGASNQGIFHETLNLAALWKLPFIAVCENNCYAATTPVTGSTSVKDIADRAKGYGIPGVIVDGNDCPAVYEAAKSAIERARRGQGPTLLECKTYRIEPHSSALTSDPRPKNEREYWKNSADPINRIIDKTSVLTKKKIKEIDNKIAAEIAEAIEFAEKSEQPKKENFIREFAGL